MSTRRASPPVGAPAPCGGAAARVSRRDVLAAAAVGAGTLVLPRRVAAEPAFATHVATPQNLSTPLEVFDRLLTPTDVFFIRSHFGPPALDRERRLRVSGMVKKPLDLAPAGLRRFREVTVTAVLQCAGNGRALHEPRVPGIQWVHGAMGQATWTGVRLVDVLEAAGLTKDARHVLFAGADLPPKPVVPAFVRSLPIERALDGTTLIAWKMNGEPLTLAHGAPLRLVVPSWPGNHWMKWLVEVRAQAEEAEGFYQRTGYRYPRRPVEPGAAVPPEDMLPIGAFPLRSLIARPAEGSASRVGPQEVVGIAFSGVAEVARVEVRIDGVEGWQEAKLEGEPGVGRWQVFRHRFEASRPGAYRITARAVDRQGAVQPEKAAWNPSGYFWNGWHSVAWTVTA